MQRSRGGDDWGTDNRMKDDRWCPAGYNLSGGSGSFRVQQSCSYALRPLDGRCRLSRQKAPSLRVNDTFREGHRKRGRVRDQQERK